MSVYKWVVVGLLWWVCFFNYADRQAVFSVFPLIKSGLGLNDAQLGLAAGAFMWAYALFGPVAGRLGDRFSRKGLILGALVFWSFFTAATALAQSFWQLAICRALGGLGEAFYFPAAMSLISDYHGSATRSRAMALHQSGVYAGTIAGGGLAGWFGQHYGWHAPFWWFGGAGILLATLLLLLLKEPGRGTASGVKPTGTLNDTLQGVFGNGRAPLLIGAFIAANFVANVFLSWLPSFLYRKFSMNLSMAGWSATAYLQTASILGVFTGGVLADHFSAKHKSARIAVQACGLLCGVPFVFLTGWTLSIPVLILSMCCFGYFKGLYDANIFAALYEVVSLEYRGVAAGVLNSLGWLGAGFAPVLIAEASSRVGMSASLSATSMIYLAGGLMLVMAARPRVGT